MEKKIYKNANFEVTFTDETHFTIVNVFGDVFECRIENDKIVANSGAGLRYAMKARMQLGF